MQSTKECLDQKLDNLMENKLEIKGIKNILGSETYKTIEELKSRPFDVNNYGGLRHDEYLEGEMIYCKKCNEPRLRRLAFDGIMFRDDCSCERERKEKEQEAQIRLKMIHDLIDASLISERYRYSNFNKARTDHNEQFKNALERCKKYCDNCEEVLKNAYGMYIYGSPGVGKTFLTACISNELCLSLKPTLLTSVLKITTEIKETFNSKEKSESDFIKKLIDIDFLIIDDLGTETFVKNNEDTWLQVKFYEILNDRYNAKKPTIFTSNYSLLELVNERGLMQKTADRIYAMSSAVIKIEGANYRAIERNNVKLPF